jgi:hypothetical protein
MSWSLSPDLPWPVFLRRLRHPSPPKGWLEEAVALEDVQRRPVLLRWIVQHPKAPAFLRAKHLPRLPWRVLAQMAGDASAHPQARHQAGERLQALWPMLSLGERRSLAPLAPRVLWGAIWRVPDPHLLRAFLLHPRLDGESLLGLLRPPIAPAHLEALGATPWAAHEGIASRVLQLLDEALGRAEPGLVLGHGVPWIKALTPDARLLVSTSLRTPALRRLVRSQADVPPDSLEAPPRPIHPP